MIKCPHCNKKDGLHRRVPMAGVYNEYIDETGEISGDWDSVREIREPKRVRCDGCGKIRTDTTWDDYLRLTQRKRSEG